MEYTNKKGNKVQVGITDHAINRFVKRYSLITGNVPQNPKEQIEKLFSRAKKITELNTHLRERQKSYKGNTIYFQCESFVFVVADGALITVELKGKLKCFN